MITRHSIFLFYLGLFMSCTEVTPQDPCDNYVVLNATSRLVENNKFDSANCDKNITEGWYHFISGKKSAIIPTQCIKNDFCGTKLGMFIDLMKQDLPAISQTINVTACSSFDILGKWDCCVLSKTIQMRRCTGDFFIYHLKPTDRCPVAYCSILEKDDVNSNHTARHGIGVNESSPFVSTTEMIADQTTSDMRFISSNAPNEINLVTTVNAVPVILSQNLVTVNQRENVTVENATRSSIATANLVKSSITNAIHTKTNKGRGDPIENVTNSGDKSLTIRLNVTETYKERKPTLPVIKNNEEDPFNGFSSGRLQEKEWIKKFSIDISTVISRITSHKTSVTPIITAFERTVTPNQTNTAEQSQDIFQEYLALFIILMIIGFLCLILLLSSCMYLYCQRHSGHWDRALAEQYHVTVVPRRDALINENPYSDDIIIQDEKAEKSECNHGSLYHGVNSSHNLSYSNSIKAINDLNNLAMRSHPNDFNSQPLDGTEGLVIPIDQFRPEKDTMNIEDTIL